MLSAIKGENSSDSPALGILVYSISIFLFCVTGAFVRFYGNLYPVNEFIFSRSLVTVLIVLGIACAKKDLSILKTKRPFMHFFRSLVGFASLTLITLSYMLLPLAEASTIQYTNTLFIAIFAWPILGERLSLCKILAICIGFSGIICAYTPEMGALNHGAVYGILGAISVAFVSIFLRQMGKTESIYATVFYFSVLCTLISGFWLTTNWVTPSFEHLCLLLLMGLVSYCSQILMTYAHKITPATILSPFNYLGMIWYASFGYFIFGDIPSLNLVIGASLVICAGLYIILSQLYRKASL